MRVNLVWRECRIALCVAAQSYYALRLDYPHQREWEEEQLDLLLDTSPFPPLRENSRAAG